MSVRVSLLCRCSAQRLALLFVVTLSGISPSPRHRIDFHFVVVVSTSVFSSASILVPEDSHSRVEHIVHRPTSQHPSIIRATIPDTVAQSSETTPHTTRGHTTQPTDNLGISHNVVSHVLDLFDTGLIEPSCVNLEGDRGALVSTSVTYRSTHCVDLVENERKRDRVVGYGV